MPTVVAVSAPRVTRVEIRNYEPELTRDPAPKRAEHRLQYGNESTESCLIGPIGRSQPRASTLPIILPKLPTQQTHQH